MQLDTDSWTGKLKQIAYPPGIRFIDRGIDGVGFYPGARKCVILGESQTRVMLLGRDFGTLDYYERLASRPGSSENTLTWRNAVGLHLPSLRPSSVFCTNFLMGVREVGSATGDLRDRMRASDWESYEHSCWEFLRFQIDSFDPHVILVCGQDNRRDLDREDRLQSVARDAIYGPHPHSAIGVRNRSQHIEICKKVRQRVRLAAGLHDGA